MKRLSNYLLILFALWLAAASLGATAPPQKVTITLVSRGGTVMFCEKTVHPTDHLVAAEIFARRINAPYKDKIEFLKKMTAGGTDYKTALCTVFPYLEAKVEQFLIKANVAPVDAEIRFDPGRSPMFTIFREKNGIKVAEGRLYYDIFTALMSSAKIEIIAKETVIEAAVKAEALIPETRLRTRYSTAYESSGADRKHNIKLALQKIDGTVLKRGETFSFNETVGRRTASNGFREAKIIVGGKYESGYGGGVCQASTTLYNAALLAGLDVTEARNHSLKVAYEKASFDAMVNSASSDLKFVNNTLSPVYIHAYGTEAAAYIEMYGSELPYIIKRKSVVISTGPDPGYDEEIDTSGKYFDAESESGSKKIISYPHSSLKSEGYLEYYDRSGRLLKTILLRRDTYYATKGVIAVAP